MEITHIPNHKDQWLFEYGTAMEMDELMKAVSRLKKKFGAKVKKLKNASVAMVRIFE